MDKQLRMTHQRELILQELKSCKSHPTADDLYERVRKKLPRISLATVYRNLEILSEAGVIRKLEISGRQKRFDWELPSHDHIYCVRCHRVDNIILEGDRQDHLMPDNPLGYQIAGRRIEFFGLCPVCHRHITQSIQGETTMACTPKNTCSELSEEQRAILDTLAKSKEACGGKEIAATAGMDAKQVSTLITALKKKGYVDSPVRCKYAITNDGKKALS